jgi:itaconyl-CoA hydratase
MTDTDQPTRRVVPGWEGRFLEDFRMGDVYRHPHGRTVTQTDNTWFTLLTANTHDIHVNADYASRTEFGKPLVASPLTLAIVTGLSVIDVSQNAVANLGWDKVRLTAPVFAGDTLYAESEVLEVRPSRTRPGQGIVRVHTRGFNQDGTTIMEFDRAVLVYARGHRPSERETEPESVKRI